MKKKNSKTATVIATYSTDLGMVLNWLKLNKAIKSIGPVRQIAGGSYAATVKGKVSKEKLNDLAKDRFGSFVRVK